MNEAQMIDKIKQLEPDFDPVEELIIQHYELKYTDLCPALQGDWWVLELARLQSLLPLEGFAAKMVELEAKGKRRAAEARNG